MCARTQKHKHEQHTSSHAHTSNTPANMYRSASANITHMGQPQQNIEHIQQYGTAPKLYDQ